MGLVPNTYLSKEQLLELEPNSKKKSDFKMVNQQQDQNSGTKWQDEARRQASMYPNLEEFLNQMMPEIQSDFLREFFNQPNNHNAGSGSTTSNAPPTAPPAQENSEENGANNSRNVGNASGWNWQNWSDNWQKYHSQQQQRPNNFQNNERTAPPEQENSEENGANNSRNTMQNNNNKDQIIFKTMKEVKYSMKMMSLFCCNELEKKSQKILLRQLVLLLVCFPF